MRVSHVALSCAFVLAVRSQACTSAATQLPTRRGGSLCGGRGDRCSDWRRLVRASDHDLCAIQPARPWGLDGAQRSDRSLWPKRTNRSLWPKRTHWPNWSHRSHTLHDDLSAPALP
jgi:hypothetical protein